jgi:outer membrane protein TolC
MKNNRVFMKSKLFIAASFLLLFPGAISLAQETSGELNLSLKEAQDYALTNNKMVLAAKADVMASKASVWEAISGALPQINASGSFIDN